MKIIVRKINYDYSIPIKNDRYWAEDDPILTHFFNAFQSTFPEGEKLFIQAAIDGVARLQRKGNLDLLFKTDLKKFIQQEALHSQQHIKWTEALVKYGYKALESYDARLRRFRIFSKKYFPIALRLAITAAAEHYTASIAYLFTHLKPDVLVRLPTQFRGLLLYHAMEELEHKSVCFDLFQNVSGSYILQIFGFIFVTLDLIINVYIRIRYLLKKDGIFNFKHRLKLYKFLFWKQGIAMGLINKIKNYINPNFHPWKTDERKLVNKVFHKLQSELNIQPFIE
ncbi:MAG: metal-dependent hydrolase [Candidatus Lokiarchaeota archaeon]